MSALPWRSIVVIFVRTCRKSAHEEASMRAQQPRSPVPARYGVVLNRRLFLGAGVAALGAAGLAACGDSSSSSSGGGGGGSATGEVTFGSNASDDVPKKAFADTFAGYTAGGGGT